MNPSPDFIALIDKLHDLDIRLRVRDGRLLYFPRRKVTPELAARLSAHKEELLAIHEDQVAPGNPPVPALASRECDGQTNEFFFRNITEQDARYINPSLFGDPPPVHPPPCPWCGGRLVHNTLCKDLRESWEQKVPYGEEKGQPLSKASTNTLQKLLRDSIGGELRAAIKNELRRCTC
jgi:hypothetical protein